MNKKSLYGVFALLAIAALGGCFGAKSATEGMIDMIKLEGKTDLMPIAVIGSGPAGLMAATYGARGGKDAFVIEGNKPGGLLMDTTEVENWPGEISIRGPEIIKKLRSQAAYQGVRFVADAIERIDVSDWPYTLYTENGDVMHALTVIIATGASPRRLGIPSEEQYWGAGVTSCAVCDAPFYKGQQVVVIGGGDSAIEEAIQLAVYAKKITILVRKDQMRAADAMKSRIEQYGDKISVKYNVEVRKIIGDGEFVTGVELYNNKTNKIEQLAANGVFLAIGHDPNTAFIQNVVQTDSAGYISVNGRTQHTSVPGIFAAGDVEDSRYRQAGSSAGHGSDAGLDAVRFLDDHEFTPNIATQIKPSLFGGAATVASLDRTTPEKALSATINTIESLDQLNRFIDRKGLALIDFWAETCPSCKQMLPVFESVAHDFAGKVSFATADSDEAIDVVEKLFVHKVPCLIAFRDGALVARYSNAMSKKELTTFVQKLLQESV